MSRFGTETVTMEMALEWARADGMYVPPKGALQAINAARDDAGLARFVLGTPAPAAAAPIEPDTIEPEDDQTEAEHIPAVASMPTGVTTITSSEMAEFARKIRSTLLAELDDLRAGRATPQRSQAVAKLVQQAVNAVRLEVDFNRDVMPKLRQIEGQS